MEYKDKIDIDITKLSVEDLKQMDLNDILVYINEMEDTRTVIIYFFKIIKQMSDQSDSNHNLVNIRKKFRATNNLEEKMDEIYSLIGQEKLSLDRELELIKEDIESELGNLKYGDLKDIKDLKEKKQEIDYRTETREYNNVKNKIRAFFNKIYTLYLNTMQERDEEKRGMDNAITLLLELQRTPAVGTGIDMGSVYEDLIQQLEEKAGLLKKNKNLKKLQERNKEKAKKFYEKQERLKKERGLI